MPVTFSIHYKLAALGASADDTKKDRALHPIYEVAGSTALDAWVLAIPRDGAVEDGIAGVLPGSLARICMPFVRCGDDIAGLSVGDNGLIKASAWERFLSTLATIHGGDGSKPITLGGLLEDMDSKISQATPAQLDELTLYQSDLGASVPVAAKPAAPGAGADAAALLLYGQELSNWEGGDKHPFAWLRALTFGDLRDGSTGNLLALGRLMGAVPTWISADVRATAGFRRTLATLAKAAVEGTDTLVGDGQEVAGCLAEKLKLVDMPRAMESFGGHSQDVRARALLKEIRAVSKPAGRQELLRERFVEATARLRGVRAIVGVRDDGGCDLSGTAGFGLCAEVAARMGLIRTEEDFAWAPLRALRDETQHLDEMLRAEPWVGNTPRARADHVIDLYRVQARRAASVPALAYPAPASGAATDSTLSAAETRTRGAVPKHFQADVAPAMAQAPYRELRLALLTRLSMGGTAALDALQIAASGVSLDALTHKPKPRHWSPLMVMLSEGAVRGIDAALIDPDLQMLTDAARDHWPELYGRTAGRQLAANKATLPMSLEGWGMPELAKAFASSDWRAIDLGAAFESARAQMRGEAFKPGPVEKAYTTRQSIDNALEVAEAILMLRGFGGNGKGTIPFILEEVRNTWMLYGGTGANAKTLEKLASEGRAFVVATLEHFGRVRNAAISSKNPLAPDHERKTTEAATQRWERHVARLQAALDLHSYVDYCFSSSSGDGGGGGSGGGGSNDNGFDLTADF